MRGLVLRLPLADTRRYGDLYAALSAVWKVLPYLPASRRSSDIDFYKRAGEEGGQALCARCEQPFASRLQVGDLKAVQCGSWHSISTWKMAVTIRTYARTCRRKNLALTQDAMWRTTGAEFERLERF